VKRRCGGCVSCRDERLAPGPVSKLIRCAPSKRNGSIRPECVSGVVSVVEYVISKRLRAVVEDGQSRASRVGGSIEGIDDVRSLAGKIELVFDSRHVVNTVGSGVGGDAAERSQTIQNVKPAWRARQDDIPI